MDVPPSRRRDKMRACSPVRVEEDEGLKDLLLAFIVQHLPCPRMTPSPSTSGPPKASTSTLGTPFSPFVLASDRPQLDLAFSLSSLSGSSRLTKFELKGLQDVESGLRAAKRFAGAVGVEAKDVQVLKAVRGDERSTVCTLAIHVLPPLHRLFLQSLFPPPSDPHSDLNVPSSDGRLVFVDLVLCFDSAFLDAACDDDVASVTATSFGSGKRVVEKIWIGPSGMASQEGSAGSESPGSAFCSHLVRIVLEASRAASLAISSSPSSPPPFPSPPPPPSPLLTLFTSIFSLLSSAVWSLVPTHHRRAFDQWERDVKEGTRELREGVEWAVWVVRIVVVVWVAAVKGLLEVLVGPTPAPSLPLSASSPTIDPWGDSGPLFDNTRPSAVPGSVSSDRPLTPPSPSLPRIVRTSPTPRKDRVRRKVSWGDQVLIVDEETGVLDEETADEGELNEGFESEVAKVVEEMTMEATLAELAKFEAKDQEPVEGASTDPVGAPSSPTVLAEDPPTVTEADLLDPSAPALTLDPSASHETPLTDASPIFSSPGTEHQQSPPTSPDIAKSPLVPEQRVATREVDKAFSVLDEKRSKAVEALKEGRPSEDDEKSKEKEASTRVVDSAAPTTGSKGSKKIAIRKPSLSTTNKPARSDRSSSNNKDRASSSSTPSSPPRNRTQSSGSQNPGLGLQTSTGSSIGSPPKGAGQGLRGGGFQLDAQPFYPSFSSSPAAPAFHPPTTSNNGSYTSFAPQGPLSNANDFGTWTPQVPKAGYGEPWHRSTWPSHGQFGGAGGGYDFYSSADPYTFSAGADYGYGSVAQHHATTHPAPSYSSTYAAPQQHTLSTFSPSFNSGVSVATASPHSDGLAAWRPAPTRTLPKMSKPSSSPVLTKAKELVDTGREAVGSAVAEVVAAVGTAVQAATVAKPIIIDDEPAESTTPRPASALDVVPRPVRSPLLRAQSMDFVPSSYANATVSTPAPVTSTTTTLAPGSPASTNSVDPAAATLPTPPVPLSYAAAAVSARRASVTSSKKVPIKPTKVATAPKSGGWGDESEALPSAETDGGWAMPAAPPSSVGWDSTPAEPSPSVAEPAPASSSAPEIDPPSQPASLAPVQESEAKPTPEEGWTTREVSMGDDGWMTRKEIMTTQVLDWSEDVEREQAMSSKAKSSSEPAPMTPPPPPVSAPELKIEVAPQPETKESGWGVVGKQKAETTGTGWDAPVLTQPENDPWTSATFDASPEQHFSDLDDDGEPKKKSGYKKDRRQFPREWNQNRAPDRGRGRGRGDFGDRNSSRGSYRNRGYGRDRQDEGDRRGRWSFNKTDRGHDGGRGGGGGQRKYRPYDADRRPNREFDRDGGTGGDSWGSWEPQQSQGWRNRPSGSRSRGVGYSNAGLDHGWTTDPAPQQPCDWQDSSFPDLTPAPTPPPTYFGSEQHRQAEERWSTEASTRPSGSADPQDVAEQMGWQTKKKKKQTERKMGAHARIDRLPSLSAEEIEKRVYRRGE